MKFKPGDRVLCIEKPLDHQYQCELGRVYTVKKYEESTFSHYFTMIETAARYGKEVAWYDEKRFVSAESYQTEVGSELLKEIVL